MFSFKSGKPIAKIIGGEYGGQILQVETDKNDKQSSCCNQECCDDCNSECEDEACCDNCKLFESEEESEEITEMDLPGGDKGYVQQIPNLDTREVVYIAGPSGSGKSTYASKYIAVYKKLYPENPIIIFSRKNSDEVLDKLKPQRFMIDESLVANPIDITQDIDGPCIVLFDDVDTIQNDKIKKAVSKLKNDILEIGRSFEVYVVITSHLINGNDRKDCRTIFNELHTFTFFPKSGNRYAINYALKNYFGLDKKMIDKLMKLPSRWITISRNCPMYALHEKGAVML